MRPNRLLFLLIFCVLLLPLSAHAAANPWQTGESYKIRLISGNVEESAGKKSVWIGIEYALDPDWKVYWRTPGDGGLPAKVTWGNSQNIANAEVSWPVPHRYVEFDAIEAYAYKHSMLLPIHLTYADSTKPIVINADVDFALCNEICLFEKRHMDLTIPPEGADAESQAIIDAALAMAPKENGQQGLKIVSTEVVNAAKEGGTIKTIATSENGFKDPDIFIESDSHYRFPKPMVQILDNGKRAEFISPYENPLDEEPVDQQKLHFTLSNQGKAVELSAQLKPLETTWNHYAFILLMAYVGGLILNIMPCVLPVLSLKLLSVLKHSGSHFREIRLSFLSSTLGIVVSFLILAGVVATLRSVGVAVGWGFQFQSPLFLTGMIIILSFFAANLLGMFEIGLPAWAGNIALKYSGGNGHGSHFGTGVFAALLATPCSAPFLGTAIGFAFTQSVANIFLTFTIMGLGLATPYILFSIFPHMVSALPKPGAWMVGAKKVLGIFLIGTAAWLLFVLSHQLGFMGAMWVAMFACLVLLLFPIIDLLGVKGKNLPSLIIAVLIVAAPFINPLSTPVTHETKPDAFWKPFEEERIPELVEKGSVVFVDVTADWCLTCKANKLLVMDTEEVTQLLSSPHVYAMKGDWTERDEVISKFLKKHGRFGIPFNIVFGSGAPEGIVLPELLSTDAVKEAVEKASGNRK